MESAIIAFGELNANSARMNSVQVKPPQPRKVYGDGGGEEAHHFLAFETCWRVALLPGRPCVHVRVHVG